VHQAAQVGGEQDATVVPVGHHVGSNCRVKIVQLQVGFTGGFHGAAVVCFHPGGTDAAGDGVPQQGSELLGGLRHHAVSFQFSISALVQDDVKHEEGKFQLTDGDIVWTQ